MSNLDFAELAEFRKDIKRLLKKYRSLNEDLLILKKVLNNEPEQSPPRSMQIGGLGIETCTIKVKKIACKSLKGRGANSGLRLIYAHDNALRQITFIELYHKNEKAMEERKRILRYFQ